MDEREKARGAASATATTPSATATHCSTASSCSSNSNPSVGTAAARTPPPSIVVPWAGRGGGDGVAGGGCYYPGCRKDANCACEMCLASINATRDLLPPEAAAARRWFAAAARDRKPASRPLFGGVDTPPHGSSVTEPWTPPMLSTAKSRRPRQEAEAEAFVPGTGKKTGGSHDWALYAAMVLGFLLLLWVDSGLVPEIAARGFGPKLSPEAVARLGTEARLAPGGLSHKLGALEQMLGQFVGGEKVCDCSSQDSVWQFEQNDRRVFYWRCAVYKSAAEEVTIWGSPLHTSGLLPRALPSRHLTLLSGKITEWSDGRVWPTVRASNGSSWSYRGRSAPAVRLEPQTWVLEYQRSVVFEGTRLIPATAELLASRCSAIRQNLARRRFFHGGAGGIQANPT
ncbi:uncharacterized protein LOC102713066 [Oryza brachyantha]|uniref:uncharacterized protein LOC102713066 n=1 Tax=Oryza brachyantha TaxID=4533 RepID=UPI001ADD3B92|nr:uncharacterized protein LOC102713066 [Oryza brachyantha]